MNGETNLATLLATLNPILQNDEFVFCTLASDLEKCIALRPIAIFQEAEGITVVLPKTVAEQNQLSFSGIFRQITLSVHSSLEAVGLTAAVASALAEQGISANIIAAYYHDHVFVPSQHATAALTLLDHLTQH